MANVCFESIPRGGLERNDGYKQQQPECSFYNKQQSSYIVSTAVRKCFFTEVELKGREGGRGTYRPIPYRNGSLSLFSDISGQLTVVQILDKPVVDAENLHPPK